MGGGRGGEYVSSIFTLRFAWRCTSNRLGGACRGKHYQLLALSRSPTIAFPENILEEGAYTFVVEVSDAVGNSTETNSIRRVETAVNIRVLNVFLTEVSIEIDTSITTIIEGQVIVDTKFDRRPG